MIKKDFKEDLESVGEGFCREWQRHSRLMEWQRGTKVWWMEGAASCGYGCARHRRFA